MVSLPPPTLPPVQIALPGAPPPPVIIPVQVVAANLTNQLLRELTLPVTTVTVTQAPPQPVPTQQSPNTATPAVSPVQLLLQIQTPQGTVQLALPATLPQQTTQPNSTPLPATLTAPQWQHLVDQGHVQLQLAPVPAALLQRLPAGTPPLLAQLIIPPRDLAKLLGTSITTTSATQPSGLAFNIATPASFTATILPPALAESYKARFVLPPETMPQIQPAPLISTLQTAVTSIRTWFDAIRPTPALPAQPQSQPQSQPQIATRLEPTLATTLPTVAAASAAATTAAAPLQQVTITLVATPQTQAAPLPPQTTPQTIETPARLLGLTPSGEKLLETGDGQVLLAPAALPLALGKPATLRITSPLDANITLQPGRTPTLATTQPALHEALEALAATAPALAARLASQTLLQPAGLPGTLAPTLLFLMAAVGINTNSGPAKATTPALAPTLRKALDTIDGARTVTPGAPAPPPLAERLLTELRQLGTGREVLDDSGQPWRGFPLPTQQGDTLQTPVTFYIQQLQPRLPDAHDRKQENTPAGAIKQTRFIVDMQLSNLGTTQLEGLSRARQLDLTLRTHTALPAALQNELTARYLEIAVATGLSGTLQFGAGQGKGQWFTPRETAGASHMNARL